jgi:8-oxo-dGTP diphosphatase
MPPHLHDDVPRFCSHCGGTLIQTLLKPGEPHRPVCRACGYVVYFDPKVVVGTIISNHRGQVAMVRRAIEPGYGKWVFPGGYVDRGEELMIAATREAWEEAHLRVHINGLVNIYSYRGQAPIVIVYAATPVGGELRAEDESSEAGWFTTLDMPWSELAFPSTRQGLRDYFQGILHPYVT